MLWWEKNGAAILSGGGELIDRQYAGPKAALRPIYDRVAEVIASFEDVEVGPRGTYVSFGRPKQFALVQPSTKTRVDVGLRLPGVPFSDRLADARSFGSGNITHRVGLEAVEDVDAELEGLAARRLRRARLTVDPAPGDHRRADAVAVEHDEVGVVAG